MAASFVVEGMARCGEQFESECKSGGLAGPPGNFLLSPCGRTSTTLAASGETMFKLGRDPSTLFAVMPPSPTLVSLKTDGPAEEGLCRGIVHGTVTLQRDGSIFICHSSIDIPGLGKWPALKPDTRLA